MDTKQAIKFLEKQIKNPDKGLPEDIFLFFTRNTPMINVDLLIKDEKGRTLLSWRDDEYCGKGWHLPGGIIRYKEKFETRIQKVAKAEIRTEVEFEPKPLGIYQVIVNEKTTRGHFISVLYKCFVSEKFVIKNKGLKQNEAGYLKWHENCPKDLLKFHNIYKKYL